MCSSTPDGTIWAGGEAGQIYKISADGKDIKEVANTGGFILGIAFRRTAHGWRYAILRISACGSWTRYLIHLKNSPLVQMARRLVFRIMQCSIRLVSCMFRIVARSGRSMEKYFVSTLMAPSASGIMGLLILLMECVYPKMKSYCTWCAHGYPV